jgi:hypothetical protein
MKHVLATTGEAPVGEGVLKGDKVMGGEAAIDPVVPPISKPGDVRGLKWYKENGMGGRAVRNPNG